MELRVPGYAHLIRVVLVEAGRGWSRLGIDAPREVSVVRGEVAPAPAAPSYGKGLEQDQGKENERGHENGG